LAAVLVTGGAGFIGSHLVRALVSQGDRVRVFDNLTTGRRDHLEGVEAELIVGDIRDLEELEGATRGTEAVYHLAAMISVAETMADPLTCYEVNLRGSLNVLEAARLVGVRAVVLASSAAVYGGTEGRVREALPARPISPYGATKLAMEEAAALFARAYGLPTVSLRLFNVYGPRQSPDSPYAAVIPRFIRRLLEESPLTIDGDGKQTRDFVYVDDVVRAMRLAAEKAAGATGPFNVGTGSSTSVQALADRLQALIPGRPAPTHGPPRPGDIRHSASDIRLAKAALGYRPEVALERGLRVTVQWFRECLRNAGP
jgi:UDP-glucose 4-epimerase